MPSQAVHSERKPTAAFPVQGNHGLKRRSKVGSRTHSSLLLLVALSWACFRIFLETLHHHRQRKHDEKIEQLRLLPRRIGKSDSNKRGQLLVRDRRGIGKQGEQPTLTTEHNEKKEAPFSSLKQQLSAATAHDKFKPKTPTLPPEAKTAVRSFHVEIRKDYEALAKQRQDPIFRGGETFHRSNCTAHNSLEWLQSPRFRNSGFEFDDSFVRRMTLELPRALVTPGAAQFYLKQSLAINTSRFIDDAEMGTDSVSERLWSVRLIFLAMMYHQSRFAIKEAESRSLGTDKCLSELKYYGVGKYDFECPGARYIVGTLQGNGIGANIRGEATSVLIAALLTDRVALLVNEAFEPTKKGWALASCPSRDYSCVHLPLGACVPTYKEIEEAYQLTAGEQRTLFTSGKSLFEDVKVIMLKPRSDPETRSVHSALAAIRRLSNVMFSHMNASDPRRPVMQQALVDRDDGYRPGYVFPRQHLGLITR
jgi:hypothetical protein